MASVRTTAQPDLCPQEKGFPQALGPPCPRPCIRELRRKAGGRKDHTLPWNDSLSAHPTCVQAPEATQEGLRHQRPSGAQLRGRGAAPTGQFMAEGAELQQPPVRLHPLPRGLLADWPGLRRNNIHQIQMRDTETQTEVKRDAETETEQGPGPLIMVPGKRVRGPAEEPAPGWGLPGDPPRGLTPEWTLPGDPLQGTNPRVNPTWGPPEGLIPE